MRPVVGGENSDLAGALESFFWVFFRDTDPVPGPMGPPWGPRGPHGAPGPHPAWGVAQLPAVESGPRLPSEKSAAAAAKASAAAMLAAAEAAEAPEKTLLVVPVSAARRPCRSAPPIP